jgi:hypothetical protein
LVEVKNQYYTPLRKWKNEIQIKLFGKYSTKDSLDISRVITQLDKLTETISIKLSDNPFKSNFKINFIDAANTRYNNKVESSYTWGSDQSIFSANLTIYNYEKTNAINFEEFIKIKIARLLVTGHFSLVNRKNKED